MALPLQRICRFLLVGSLAFIVDAGTLVILTASGLSPLVARFISIILAMMVAWLLNREITFKLKTPPTWREFLRYITLAWVSAAVNFTIFTVLITTSIISNTLIATVISTMLSMVISYLGMSKIVFHRP